MTNANKTWSDFFHGCPGAQVGNPPDPSGSGIGIIVVDATKILPALAYCKRRKWSVTATHQSDHGVALQIQR